MGNPMRALGVLVLCLVFCYPDSRSYPVELKLLPGLESGSGEGIYFLIKYKTINAIVWIMEIEASLKIIDVVLFIFIFFIKFIMIVREVLVL